MANLQQQICSVNFSGMIRVRAYFPVSPSKTGVSFRKDTYADNVSGRVLLRSFKITYSPASLATTRASPCFSPASMCAKRLLLATASCTGVSMAKLYSAVLAATHIATSSSSAEGGGRGAAANEGPLLLIPILLLLLLLQQRSITVVVRCGVL